MRAPPQGRGGSPLAALLAAVALAAACSGGDDGGGPRPTSVMPDRGPLTVPVPVRIEGEFHATVKTDFSRPDQSEVDARFEVRLGDVALDDVQLRPDGSLGAVVPARLATGPYDLVVVDPQGRVGTLPRAYRVLAPEDTTSLVAGFRFDFVRGQEAFQPFAVTVTAVDAGGATVETFHGAVRLTDATGTAVPPVAGLFVAGRWSGRVEIRAPSAANALTATDDQGHAGSSAPFAVAPALAAHLAFASAPLAARAGRCEGPVTLALYDAFGTPTEASGPTHLSLAATPAVGFALFDDDSCTTVLGAPALAAGERTATAWYRATRAGPLDLLASGPSLGPATQRHTVAPAPPAALAFVSTPQTVNADVCSQAATVEVRDAYGNPSPSAGVAIPLEASPPGALTFYSDAGCTDVVSQIVVAAGGTRSAFHFRGTVAQTVTATARPAGLGAASQDEIVTPQGTASKLAVLSPARTTVAGGCSEEVTLQAQDSFGNAVASAGAIQVALSAPEGSGVGFFSDPGCTAPISALVIGAGQSTTGFRTRGTRAGSFVVTASSTTLTDAEQAQVVVAGPPAQLAFGSAAQTVAAGSCSGETTLVLQDAYGNVAIAGAPVPVSLVADPGAGFAFHSDPLCTSPAAGATIAAGASSTRAYFRGTKAGTVSMSATVSGLGGAAQAAEIRAAPADRLVFVTSAQTIAAGACSGAATVETTDPYGNPSPVAAGAAVALSASPAAGFAFFRDAACLSPAASASVPAGGARASFFFAGTAPGAVIATAAAPGLAPATQQETVNPAPPAQLAFTTPEQTLDAGVCSGPLTVQTRDPFGNASAAAAASAVDLSALPAAGLTFHAAEGCAGPVVTSVVVLAGSSTATFSLRATTAGPLTVTASSASLEPASQAETVRAAAADRLSFASTAQTQMAGACSEPVVLQARDPYGNVAAVAAATAVALEAAPPDGFEFYPELDGSCETPLAGGLILPPGASEGIFRFKGTSIGDVTVTAWPTGLGTTAQVERITEAAPDHLAISGGPRTLTAGDCSGLMTVRSVDAYGNVSPVATAMSVALAAVPATGFTFHAGAGCGAAGVTSIEIAAGASAATFSFRGTAAGSVTITASADGRSPVSEVETVTAAPPHHLAFVTGAQTRTAGACSAAVTLQRRDAYENPAATGADGSISLVAAPAAGFALHAGAGCAGGEVAAIPLPAGASSATFSFRGTVARGVTVTASAPGLAPDPVQVETIVAGPPDHLVFEGGSQSIPAETCSAPVRLRAVDAHGNASALGAAATVALSAAPAAGFRFHADVGCAPPATTTVTIGAGASAVDVTFVGTVAGTVRIAATAAGMTPDPEQDHAIEPAPPDRLVFLSAPQTTAAGQCSAAALVESRDVHGNPSPVLTDEVATLSAAPGAGFSFYSDPECATTIAAVSLARGTRTADFHWRGTTAIDVGVTASIAGWAAPASQTASVTPAPTSRFAWDPIDSPQAQGVPFAVTVRARDAWGNATPGFTGTASLSASAGPVSCASSCSGAAATGGFTAGVWTGSVAVQVSGTGVTMAATSGPVSGTSNAFAVTGASLRSPPAARFTVSPAVILAGQTVTLDASASSDYQTPAAQLEVSWDAAAIGTASFASTVAPDSAPWTAWTTAKAAVHTYTVPGIYQPRVAVRDDEPLAVGGPDVGYAAATVVVLPNATSLCTVNTAADVDDGATSCSGGLGSDGKLSLREAVRVIDTMAGTPTVTFSGPMTISGSGTDPLMIRHPVSIVAPAGVILDTVSLVISAQGVLVSGLELARLGTPVVITAAGEATIRDVHVHDGYGMAVLGKASLSRVRMAGCTVSCVKVDDRNYAQLAVSQSEFRSTTGLGIDLVSCADPAPSGVYEFSPSIGASVFSGFDVGVRSSCGGAAVYSNTFVANGTGVLGSGAYLLNNVFSGQTFAALYAGNCNNTNAFGAYRRQQIVWQNASDGCLAGDLTDPATATSSADPLYVFPAARDYRIQFTSPAKDGGYDYWESDVYRIDLNDAGPGLFFGANPDRGGRETY